MEILLGAAMAQSDFDQALQHALLALIVAATNAIALWVHERKAHRTRARRRPSARGQRSSLPSVK